MPATGGESAAPLLTVHETWEWLTPDRQAAWSATPKRLSAALRRDQMFS